MNVTLRYRLSEEGRKAALLAGKPATHHCSHIEDVADLAPFADVITVDHKGVASIDGPYAGVRYLDAVPDATALATHIRERRAAQARENEEEQARRRDEEQAAQAAREQRHADFLANPEARVRFVGAGDLRFADWPAPAEGFDSTIPAHAEALRRKEADEAARAAEAEQRRQAAEARAEAERAWSIAFVAEHGDANVEARLLARMLPQPELLDLVHDVTFAPLDETFPRYLKMTWREVCQCEDEDYDGPCSVEFHSTGAELASAQAWDRLQAIRAACAQAPGLQEAKVTLRNHVGQAERCDATLTRSGVLVEAQAGPFPIRREYEVD